MGALVAVLAAALASPASTTDCAYAAHDWNGITMGAARGPASTQALCCVACQNTPPCAAGVLDAGGQCYLKANLTSATGCTGCTSCLAGTPPPHPSPHPPPTPPPTPPPAPAPGPTPAPEPPCGFYMVPCGSFVFPVGADAPFQMEIDPVTLGLRNLTARRGGRAQGFLEPAGYYSNLYKKVIELKEQPMWTMNVSDCASFVPQGHRLDASWKARNTSFTVGEDGVLRLLWEGVSLPPQMNLSNTVDVEITVTPAANATGLALRAAVTLGAGSRGKVCLQSIVLPQIATWFRSDKTENAFIPDMFGHTGNCSGLCKMEFKQALYDDTNGVAEFAYMPQGGARTMQWWATWSNFTANKDDTAALGLFAGFLDPIGYMKQMLIAGTAGLEPGQLHAYHFPADVTTELGSNPYTMPYEFLLQSFSAPDLDTGWFDAAELYRAWALREASWMAPGTLRQKVAHGVFPQWLLETPLWIQLNPYGTPCTGDGKCGHDDTRSCCRPGNNIENVLWLREQLGVPIAAFWNQWNTEPGNTKNPIYTPNERFRNDSKALEDAGIRVVPYTNGRIMDPSNAGHGGGASVSPPIGGHPEEFACHSSQDEKIYREIYQGPPLNVSYWVMDPVTDYWQDMLAGVAATLTSEFNLSGVYVDQISSMYAEPCFNRQRAGTLAEGGGQFGAAWANGVRAVYEKATSRMGAATHALFSEAQAEPYIGQISGNMALYGWKRCGFVPAFQAVYGGYTTMSGIMGWPLPNHTDTSLTHFQRGDLPSWRAYLGYQLVYGSLLSWEEIEDIAFILKNSAKDLDFVRTLVHFRLAHGEYLVHGRVVRPPTVLGAPLPTMSMFGNYNLEVYRPCAEPLVVTNVFEAQNGSVGYYFTAQTSFIHSHCFISPTKYSCAAA